jgi:hypothetical protein
MKVVNKLAEWAGHGEPAEEGWKGVAGCCAQARSQAEGGKPRL